jgi:hypothetical protein
MRKLSDAIPHFSAIPLQELATTNRAKKQLKPSDKLQHSLTITPIHSTVMSTKVKSLTWDAYRNELEFE